MRSPEEIEALARQIRFEPDAAAACLSERERKRLCFPAGIAAKESGDAAAEA